MRRKEFQLFGIGNAIVDIIVDISEEDFSSLMLTKGSMNLVSEEVQAKILLQLSDKKQSLVSGGSLGNSAVAFQQLGGRAAFCGLLGNDTYGRFYKSEFEELGIRLSGSIADDKPTGTSLILVTPDAERTMNTCLGAAATLSEHNVDGELIGASEWVYIEGYLLSQADTGNKAALAVARAAKERGAKVAITFSDGFLVSGHRKELESMVELADLIFANHNEASTYTGINDSDGAFTALKNIVPNVVLTRSERGVLVHYEGQDYSIPAFSCVPVDLTGAGDMLAGAFLYGICNSYSPPQAARAACFLAMKVITQVGARLKGDIRELWQTALTI